jgi:hypothetical protein
VKKTSFAGIVLKWVVGPIAVMVLAAALGDSRSGARKSPLLGRIASLSDAELRELETFPAAALANAAWTLGDTESVRVTTQAALDVLPDGPARARLFLRLALVDDTADGLAALFARACAADSRTCGRPSEMAAFEASRRLVASGNRLPPSVRRSP